MTGQTDEYDKLFREQVSRLELSHFLILYWAAQSEGLELEYNITNLFDDLKSAGITRTKQTAVAAVISLATLCFVDLREEHNRKNIYITRFGAKALESMIRNSVFNKIESTYLRGRK